MPGKKTITLSFTGKKYRNPSYKKERKSKTVGRKEMIGDGQIDLRNKSLSNPHAQPSTQSKGDALYRKLHQKSGNS